MKYDRAIANPPKKRASIYTLGCRLNQAETQLLTDRLAAEGYEVVPFGDDADLGIINTCTVTREADAKSRQMVRRFIRKNPEAFTAVIGCYGQMGYEALSNVEGVDLIVGTEEKLNVLHYAREGKPAQPIIIRDGIGRDDFTIEADPGAADLHRPNLKIQDGCNFMCSFCVIPFARGRARSRRMDDLIDEARSRVDQGAKELVITGVNVGTYDLDGMTIEAVVNRLADIPGLERIRISSIEPTTVPGGILDAMAAPDHPLVPYLHLPLQSGSDRVLDRMRRRYTAEEYIDYVQEAAIRVPNICIGTDVMVGMQGETDEDFEETRTLIEEQPIAYAHVFKFSLRPGTAAQRLDGTVSPQEMDRRGAVLRKLSAEKQRAFSESYCGREVLVLFEEVENGVWSGYSDNYIRVAVESTGNLSNEIRPVRIERVAGDWAVGVLTNGG